MVSEWTFKERIEEYSYPNENDSEQCAIYEHLSTWSQYSHIFDLFSLHNSINSMKLIIINLAPTKSKPKLKIAMSYFKGGAMNCFT